MKDTFSFIEATGADRADLLKNAKITVMKHSDLKKCPHTIFMPEHYRPDGTCRCDDKSAVVMREWGYKWRNGQWR